MRVLPWSHPCIIWTEEYAYKLNTKSENKLLEMILTISHCHDNFIL